MNTYEIITNQGRKQIEGTSDTDAKSKLMKSIPHRLIIYSVRKMSAAEVAADNQEMINLVTDLFNWTPKFPRK